MQKSYKDNYTQVKSYRPIALFNTIRKTLKSIFIKKISTLAEIYYLLPKTYFGRKKNALTEYVV